jgi:sulfate adenylyltransferase
MIPPHGNTLVDRFLSAQRSERVRSEFESYPKVRLDKGTFFDLVNIATGRYSPLKGFMGRNDFHKVVRDLTLESGVGWPIPIVLDVGADLASRIGPGDRLGLETPEGEPAGYLEVGEIFRYNVEETATDVFGTADDAHPGVELLEEKAPFLVGGNVSVLESVREAMDQYLTPSETRVLFDQLGWDTVVGFQTRNAPHRGHEYIQKSALEHVDGIFIHPKFGKKKSGDYTDEAILAGYQALVEHYYPERTVVISPLPSRMWYAGPREAVFDAIVRKNHGCTHFIVGRDHAGVGDYYGDFEAQALFDAVPEIGIERMFFHYAFYCKRCDGMASEKICPHEDAQVYPSGTKIRGLLREGEIPPGELMRPEVAQYIKDTDQSFIE